MAVEATEKWIRKRVDLNYENLGDVRSLSLPGSYHEKITCLGTSLQSFERLKNLDLSRNSLINLEGLDHLSMLETLNLYYNNISSLKDLFLLRHNSQLQELDLRLNPVTKNEPDYRLFVVHMLPNLRKLDDRSVRDSERKAALLHFNSEQANELTEHSPELKGITTTERTYQPRVDYVRGMTKKTAVVEDDDSELLDLIARTGGDLRKPRHLSGSSATGPSVEHHEREVTEGLTINRETTGQPDYGSLPQHDSYPSPPSLSRPLPIATHSRDLHDDREEMYSEPNHNQSRGVETYTYSKQSIPVPSQNFRAHSPGRPRTKVQFQDDFSSRRADPADPNLKFIDEMEAYTSYKTTGHFTPNPKSTEMESKHRLIDKTDSKKIHQSIQPQLLQSDTTDRTTLSDVSQDSVTTSPHRRPTENRHTVVQAETAYKLIPMSSYETREAKCNKNTSSSDSSLDSVSEEFLTKLLNLVDRYWNGSKSLHKHQKFQGQARTMLSNFVSDVTATSQQKADIYQKDLAKFAQENVSLRGQLTNTAKENSLNQINHEGLQNALQLAQDDVDVLKKKLHQAKEENLALKNQVISMNTDLQTVQTVKSSEIQSKHISVLEDENETLQREIDKMRLQLKHFTQIQELTNMLQESHKSLVTTNDHLLQELNETKDRHSNEVKQLHWSYGELKRTMDIVPKYTNSQGIQSNSFMSDTSHQRRYNGDVLT